MWKNKSPAEINDFFIDLIEEDQIDTFLQMYEKLPTKSIIRPDKILDAMIMVDNKSIGLIDIIDSLLQISKNKYNTQFLNNVVEFLIYSSDDVLLRTFTVFEPNSLAQLLNVNWDDFMITYLQHDHKTSMLLWNVVIILRNYLSDRTINKIRSRIREDIA